MIKIITFVMFFIFNTSSYSQNLAKGIIIDSENHQIVSYVNIGILKKNIGTISNEKGEFEFDISKNYENDTIAISSVGYKTKLIPVKTFLTNLKIKSIIEILPKITELEEVKLVNTALKEKIIGNKTKSKNLRFPHGKIGDEYGIKIEIKESPTYIEKLHLNIIRNEGKTMKFRINFYNIKNELPNEKIIEKNIIFQIDIEKGKFTLDLEKYNIVVEEDFYCTIELLEKQKNDNRIFFSSIFFGDNIFRKVNQREWYKSNRIALGLNFSVKY